MDEFEIQVNLIERMARIEEKIDQLTGVLPLVGSLGERVIRAEEHGKSAMWRMSELEAEIANTRQKVEKVKKEIYWTAGVVVASINFVFFLIEKMGGRGV